MKPLVTHEGLALPVDAANIDTDILVPKQYLKRVERTGLSDYLFDRWRYLDRGNATDDPYVDCKTRQSDPDFALNKQQFAGATFLLARENFGCGSSREQAVWAIAQWGFRVVVAPSFGDIFFNNCFANGILPVVLAPQALDTLFQQVAEPGYRLQVDLPAQEVGDLMGNRWHFDIDPFRKQTLLAGLDAIALTLTQSEVIAAYEHRHWAAQPWLSNDVPRFSPDK